MCYEEEDYANVKLYIFQIGKNVLTSKIVEL